MELIKKNYNYILYIIRLYSITILTTTLTIKTNTIRGSKVLLCHYSRVSKLV